MKTRKHEVKQKAEKLGWRRCRRSTRRRQRTWTNRKRRRSRVKRKQEVEKLG